MHFKNCEKHSDLNGLEGDTCVRSTDPYPATTSLGFVFGDTAPAHNHPGPCGQWWARKHRVDGPLIAYINPLHLLTQGRVALEPSNAQHLSGRQGMTDEIPRRLRWSPAARGRELKPGGRNEHNELAQSPAARGRELKQDSRSKASQIRTSPAARGRELKQPRLMLPPQLCPVARCARA